MPASATETGGTKTAAARLVLSYVPDDRAQARAITAWLRERGMAVELLPESDDQAKPPAQTEDAKVVRLWTRAARRFWLSRPVKQRAAMEHSLLLRIEAVELPLSTEGATLTTIDWVDWQSLIDSPDANALLDRLRRWSEGEPGETQAEPEDTDTKPATDATDRSAEIQALLKYQVGETRELPTFWISRYPITNR